MSIFSFISHQEETKWQLTLFGWNLATKNCTVSTCGGDLVVKSNLHNFMECRPPDSSVHGTFQARILEWVSISFSRVIFLTQESNLCLLHCRCIFLFFTIGSPGKPLYLIAVINKSHVYSQVMGRKNPCYHPLLLDWESFKRICLLLWGGTHFIPLSLQMTLIIKEFKEDIHP